MVNATGFFIVDASFLGCDPAAPRGGTTGAGTNTSSERRVGSHPLFFRDIKVEVGRSSILARVVGSGGHDLRSFSQGGFVVTDNSDDVSNLIHHRHSVVVRRGRFAIRHWLIVVTVVVRNQRTSKHNISNLGLLTPLARPSVGHVAKAFRQVEQLKAGTFVLGRIKRTVTSRMSDGEDDREDGKAKHGGRFDANGEKMRSFVAKDTKIQRTAKIRPFVLFSLYSVHGYRSYCTQLPSLLSISLTLNRISLSVGHTPHVP